MYNLQSLPASKDFQFHRFNVNRLPVKTFDNAVMILLLKLLKIDVQSHTLMCHIIKLPESHIVRNNKLSYSLFLHK